MRAVFGFCRLRYCTHRISDSPTNCHKHAKCKPKLVIYSNERTNCIWCTKLSTRDEDTDQQTHSNNGSFSPTFITSKQLSLCF